MLIDTDILIDAGRAVGEAVTFLLSHGLLIPDALIAATAIVINEPLATKNHRDYRFITGLTLSAYP
ncbi:MAG: hypothetical protein DCC55_02120 [Chloroflexi bacterium]|nr:MAG: hypothetical protein DCC55_02120 [Chloroflexota bacterium]